MRAVERAAVLLGARAHPDHPVGPMTTYRVGGNAALFTILESERDIEVATEAVSETGIEVLVLGKGSNMIIADGGFPGLVVQLAGDFATIEIDREALTAVAGAAVAFPVLARRTAAAGLTGLEWAVGVPGSVGGAVRMNAGGHGSDTARVLVSARIVDLSDQVGPNGGADLVGEVPVASLGLGYRKRA